MQPTNSVSQTIENVDERTAEELILEIEAKRDWIKNEFRSIRTSIEATMSSGTSV